MGNIVGIKILIYIFLIRVTMALKPMQLITEAEKKALSSIENAHKKYDEITESAKKEAEKEHQKIVKLAHKKSQELLQKAEKDASVEIVKIRNDGQNDISEIKSLAKKNMGKAVDLIIDEICVGE